MRFTRAGTVMESITIRLGIATLVSPTVRKVWQPPVTLGRTTPGAAARTGVAGLALVDVTLGASLIDAALARTERG